MKARVIIGRAERQAKLVDTLLLARYMLRMFDGTRVCGQCTAWKIDLGPELGRLDALLEMAGVDLSLPTRLPVRTCDDG